MESAEKMEKKDNVVRITYKLVKKADGMEINKLTDEDEENSISEKIPSKVVQEEEDDEDDEDDIPLIKMNLKAKFKLGKAKKDLTVAQPRKTADKSKKKHLNGQQSSALKREDLWKVKPSYCRVCFIKTANERDALEHEKCHDAFRKADGRWICVICADQFPFYCDLLNHFLNHRDILELYSVYLSNLDTSLDANKQELLTDEESDEIETELKDELDHLFFRDETQIQDALDMKSEITCPNEVPVEQIQNKNNYKMETTDINLILKSEPNYEVFFQSSNLDESFQNCDEDLKLETEEICVKKEILDDELDDGHVYIDDMAHEGFDGNDSDEDKPLSASIMKRNKKKKSKKKKCDEDVEPKKKIKKRIKKVKKKIVESDEYLSDEQTAKKARVKKKIVESDEYLSDEQTAKKARVKRACKVRRTVPYVRYYRIRKCAECDYETTKKVEMEIHAAEHVAGEPMLCELCDFRCKIERQLLKHKRVEHEGYKFFCDSCEFTSKTIANLRGHMVVHGERKIGCNLCGKMFRRKNNLKDHLKTHTDDRPYKCSECPKTFKDPKSFKLHLLGSHNIIQRLTCGYCDFETDVRHELNMHKASLHHSLYMRLATVKNDEGEMVETIIHACNMCDYIANTEANLKSHLIVHEEKNISCEVCGKLFRRLGNLLEHQRSHSEKRPYNCPVCPAKAFKDNKSYRRHIARQHDMIEMIKCDICDYKTHTQGLMRIHAMKHSGQLRFQCNECSYACMTRNTMQRHKLVHKDVFPIFNCELCNFQSVSDRAVKRHKQVHAEK